VIGRAADINWKRNAFAEMVMGDGIEEVLVFCVVAVSLVGLFRIWVLLMGVRLVLGDGFC